MAAPSFDDLYNIGKAEMLIRRPDLFLAAGDMSDFIVAAMAAMGDKNTQFSAEEFRKTFVDGAKGADLTVLADDHFAIIRSAAAKSTSSVVFTRPTDTAGAGTIDGGTTISTVEDESGERVEFVTDADVVFGALDLTRPAVTITAVDTGRDGNVGAATVINIVDSVFDTTFTLTNAAAAAGGNDEESDAQLRERIRDFPTTLRRGTLAALEFGSLIVPAVRVATASETASGIVTVFVTDESGNSNAQMVADVIVELENWRCAGSVVQVTGGVIFSQNIDITIIASSGTDVDIVFTDMQAAITERVSRLGVGDGSPSSEGVLRRSAIVSAAIGVDPDNILDIIVNTPSADVVPAVAQVVRVGTITKS